MIYINVINLILNKRVVGSTEQATSQHCFDIAIAAIYDFYFANNTF